MLFDCNQVGKRSAILGLLDLNKTANPFIFKRLAAIMDCCYVRLTGLEPARPETLDPKSSASTNSATGATSKYVFLGMHLQR